MPDPLLELEGIQKRFGGVVALGGVSLTVLPGEVLALVGENGAGKSTLMKVIGGVHQPDAGTMRVDGEVVRFAKPADSLGRGIAFIHQELSVLDNLDVAGNVFLGREKRTLGLLDRGAMRRESAVHLRRLGMTLDPATSVGDLSLAQCQMVEIARALSTEARLIIMDEPTSSLTLEETGKLLEVTDRLRRDGVSVIYVSHRLGEIEQIADRVTVLRDGRNAGGLLREDPNPKGQILHDNMVRLMVGRDVKAPQHKPRDLAGGSAVRLEGVRTRAFPRHAVSLDVRAGEILGVAGLVGAGRSALAQTIFGVEPLVGGTIYVNDAPLRLATPRDAIAAGIYLVPEDRRGRGLLTDFPVRSNVTLPGMPQHSTLGLIRGASERAAAEEARGRLGVKTASIETRVVNLSGGNQQKVVLAKWLALKDADGNPVLPKLFILDEPTRGIDVGAKAGIYKLMRDLADGGTAVLMISSDMEEVLAVSDRVAVMREGAVTGILGRVDCTEQRVMNLAVTDQPPAKLAG